MRLVAVVALLLTCVGCGKTWERDAPLFVATMAEAAHKNAGLTQNGQEDAPYKGKRVRWMLKFQSVNAGKDGPTIDFDLEPLGIQKKLFDSKYPVMLSFEPDASVLADWQRTTPGTLVTLEGTIDTVGFFRMSPSVGPYDRGPSVSYDVALAVVKGVRLIGGGS